MKYSGLAILIITAILIWNLIPGILADSQEKSGNSTSFSFNGTVGYQDIEGGFFGVITDTSDQLLPIDLPKQYAVDGLRISGIAKPQTDMVSGQMWGKMVSLELVSPLNDGGISELSWYPAAQDADLSVPDDAMFPVLCRISADLQKKLDTIDGRLAAIAENMSHNEYGTEDKTAILSSLTGNLPGVYEASILDKSGHIVAVSPDVYQSSIGTDVSEWPHIASLLTYPVPTVSRYVPTVEGKNAIIITYPIFSRQKTTTGFVSVLIDPTVFVNPDQIPGFIESGYSLMVIQPDGTMIYETDQSQIGRSTWNDPVFQSSPTLLASAVHLQNARAGYDQYEFNQNSSDKSPVKHMVWTTIGLQGTPWRVVVIKPES